MKIAKTEAKRDAIRWFRARQIFCEKGWWSNGLNIARLSNHKDALFLVSLFPEPPLTTEAALSVVSGYDDARCLCWAIMFRADNGLELMRKAAHGGHAWAQWMLSQQKDENGVFNAAYQRVWLEKAAANGEPNAMCGLGCYLWNSECG